MKMGRRLAGLRRRWFRAALRQRVRHGCLSREPGERVVSGYGFGMRYPDELIWSNQVLQIFGRDCYGAGTLPGRPVVIDGGANIGTFACWVKWLRPQAHVLAVEPCRENIEYLKANVCGLPAPAVEIAEAALGRSVDTPITISGAFSDAMRIAGDSGEPVRVIPLADLIGDRVDLLKLDIEGGELNALLSAGSALRRVRRVELEYHRYWDHSVHLSRIVSALVEQGFDRFRLFDHCDYEWNDPELPQYCCLLEAARSGRQNSGNG